LTAALEVWRAGGLMNGLMANFDINIRSKIFTLHDFGFKTARRLQRATSRNGLAMVRASRR
jgi:hypothetical protein